MSGEVKQKDCISELVEIESVLAWASENVFACARLMKPLRGSGGWSVTVNVYNPNHIQGQTLYQALHTAWEKRDE